MAYARTRIQLSGGTLNTCAHAHVLLPAPACGLAGGCAHQHGVLHTRVLASCVYLQSAMATAVEYLKINGRPLSTSITMLKEGSAHSLPLFKRIFD